MSKCSSGVSLRRTTTRLFEAEGKKVVKGTFERSRVRPFVVRTDTRLYASGGTRYFLKIWRRRRGPVRFGLAGVFW